MKTLKQLSRLLFLFLFFLLISSCEKVNPGEDLILDSNMELATSQLKAAEVNSSSEINYLLDLFATIETMYDEGLLNKGNANALISKIENAIKSLEKGNTKRHEGKKSSAVMKVTSSIEKSNDNSAKGQLKAFNNEI